MPASWELGPRTKFYTARQAKEEGGDFSRPSSFCLLSSGLVTMLSSYLVLNRLELLNTHGAVILPAVFSTFPVFLSYGGFRAIPAQLFEAARIDGAGEFTIFRRIGLPLGKSGLLSAMVLGFLEYWNMMEQPMAFLDDKALWPLSLYLPEITWVQAGSAFCTSIITLIPAVFVFVLGQDYLEQGIIYSGLKE